MVGWGPDPMWYRSMSANVPVHLQIYDLVEQTPILCGFFHTGILVNGVEWCFGEGGGICGQNPGSINLDLII